MSQAKFNLAFPKPGRTMQLTGQQPILVQAKHFLSWSANTSLRERKTMFMIFGSIHRHNRLELTKPTFLRPQHPSERSPPTGLKTQAVPGRGEWSSAQGPAHNLMNCALREPGLKQHHLWA